MGRWEDRFWELNPLAPERLPGAGTLVHEVTGTRLIFSAGGSEFTLGRAGSHSHNGGAMFTSLRPRVSALLHRTKSALRVVSGRNRGARALLRSAAGLPVPVYLAADGTPSAQPVRGPIPHRVMVCSIPKAGTYLVGEVLHRLGTVASGFHFSTDGHMFMDARFATREEARNEFARFCHGVPLERALPLVRPGQHAVSHLECTPRTRALLAEFRVVFVYRDLRDALVSWLRFHQDTGREQQWNWIWERHADRRARLAVFLGEAGELFFGMCRALVPWLTEPSAFPVRFETLHGDEGPEARERLCRALAAFLCHARPADAPDTVLPGLTTTPTLTSSGARTRREEYWSAAAEELFLRLGGGELNAALGYGSAWAEHTRVGCGRDCDCT
jgi:hypothetical protein